MKRKTKKQLLEESYSDFENLTNISAHGGKRKGSGRPKLKKSEKKEPTKVMRIPNSKVEDVKTLIKK